MLTKRARVHATIARGGLDAIPWQFDLTSAIVEKLKAFYGVEDLGETLEDHMAWVPLQELGTVPQPEDPDLLRDELGAVWRRGPRDYRVGDWGELVDYPLKSPSLKGYAFPDGLQPLRRDHVTEIRRKYTDHFIVANGFGLFENGWALCGFENYLGYIAGEPQFIQELTEGLAEFSCAVTRQIAGLDVDAIRFGDDWGFQDRLMLRPELWRKTFKKHYRKIYEAARDAGLIVTIHSCGNITDILPDLIEIGVQVVNALQPEAMDVAYCKRMYGSQLTFWGGLGCQSTLPFGTPNDVRREVQDRLQLFKDGGYILAPAGAVPTETPAENIAAIVELAKKQLKDAF
jgi:uroporphyrinogen decarboxylase